MTNKQKFASKRNWMKARIIGIVFDNSVLSESERAIANSIKANLDILKERWDEQSHVKFGMKVAKYRCWCGKATNVDRKVEFAGKISNVCKAHYSHPTEFGKIQISTKLL